MSVAVPISADSPEQLRASHPSVSTHPSLPSGLRLLAAHSADLTIGTAEALAGETKTACLPLLPNLLALLFSLIWFNLIHFGSEFS